MKDIFTIRATTQGLYAQLRYKTDTTILNVVLSYIWCLKKFLWLWVCLGRFKCHTISGQSIWGNPFLSQKTSLSLSPTPPQFCARMCVSAHSCARARVCVCTCVHTWTPLVTSREDLLASTEVREWSYIWEQLNTGKDEAVRTIPLYRIVCGLEVFCVLWAPGIIWVWRLTKMVSSAVLL